MTDSTATASKVIALPKVKGVPKVTGVAKEKARAFHADLEKGAYGEYLVKKYLQKFFEDKIDYAEDKSAVKKYQKADIDFLVQFRDRAIQGVEAKNDITLWPNLFFETISVKREFGEDTPGCMLASEAEILFYVYEALNIAVIVPLEKLREWVVAYEKCDGELATKEVTNIGYLAEGKPLPVRLLMGEHAAWPAVEGIKLVDLGTNEQVEFAEFDKRRKAKLKESDGNYYVKTKKDPSWKEKSKRLWRNADQIDIPLQADLKRYKKSTSHIKKWME